MKWEWKLSLYWTSILLSINVSGDVRGRQPGQPPGGRADERAGLRAGAAPPRGGAAATPPAGARLPHPRPLSLAFLLLIIQISQEHLEHLWNERRFIHFMQNLQPQLVQMTKKLLDGTTTYKCSWAWNLVFKLCNQSLFTPFPMRIMLCAMIQLWDTI